MDKKTIRETMEDGYRGMFDECRYHLKNRLSRITNCFDEETECIERSKRFWNDISDERIAREQRKYLLCQKKLTEMADLMENLETLIKEETN